MTVETETLLNILNSVAEDLPIFVEDKAENRALGPPPGLENFDWQNDPVSTKLEKIKGIFLNAKTPTEVYVEASRMLIGDWLEMAAKFGKQTEVGPVQITSIRIELPPTNLGQQNTIEVDIPT